MISWDDRFALLVAFLYFPKICEDIMVLLMASENSGLGYSLSSA